MGLLVSVKKKQQFESHNSKALKTFTVALHFINVILHENYTDNEQNLKTYLSCVAMPVSE